MDDEYELKINLLKLATRMHHEFTRGNHTNLRLYQTQYQDLYRAIYSKEEALKGGSERSDFNQLLASLLGLCQQPFLNTPEGLIQHKAMVEENKKNAGILINKLTKRIHND